MIATPQVWLLAFSGIWMKEWEIQQGLYYQRRNSKKTGQLWLSQLMRKFWDLARALWEQRNHRLHKTKLQTAHLAVVKSIDDIYAIPRSCYPIYLRKRLKPRQTLHKTTPEYQKIWLNAFRTYQRNGGRDVDNTSRNRRQILRQLRQHTTLRQTHPTPTQTQIQIREELRNYRLQRVTNRGFRQHRPTP